jgi:hypothetical protein
MEHRHAFVLRIWFAESITPAGQRVKAMRGTLQAINSNEPIYFHSLRQLNDLLESALNLDDLLSSTIE